MNKKCLLTGYTESISKTAMIDFLIDNKREYANSYGWDFVCKKDSDFDLSKPASFSKIRFILDLMDTYDLIFWNDLDSIFTNFTIDISKSLEPGEYIGAFYEQPKKKILCAGNLLIVKNDYTKEFFESFYSLDSWKNHLHPWEQRCLNELALKTNYNHIRRFTIGEFGSFAKEGWWHIRPWESGDFMVHICPKTGATRKWPFIVNCYLKKYRELVIR